MGIFKHLNSLIFFQEQDLSAIYGSNDGWNQYATFPRDRRTSSSTSTKSNPNRLVNATLDKGSDDIDYQRNSSPETTDNSTSSLESAQILRNKLLNMETVDMSLPRSRSRKESCSDEEQFSRGRSKSLTGREVRGTFFLPAKCFLCMLHCFQFIYDATDHKLKNDTQENILYSISFKISCFSGHICILLGDKGCMTGVKEVKAS